MRSSFPSLRKALAAGGTALGLAAAGLAPAVAAPPVNDEPAGAVEITTVPTRLTADTREATRDAVSRRCVGAHSVWYRYTPTTTDRIRFSTVGSDFDTFLAVYTGGRQPRDRIACNDDRAGLQSAVRPLLEAGRPAWIAVSSCCSRPGGQAVLHVYPPEPPEVDVTIDGAEAGGVSGRMRVTGTATCATPSLVRVRASASQRNGDHVARGTGRHIVTECDDDPVSWTVRVDSETGWAFVAGTVAVDVQATGTDGFNGDRVEAERNVEATTDVDGRVAH